MKRLLSIASLAAALTLPAGSQCVMCFRTAQSQQAARAKVLNMGILALGIPPFAILTGFVVFVFKRDHIDHGE